MVKKVLLVMILVVAALAGAAVGRTLTLRPPVFATATAQAPPVDADTAARRLAGAVQIPTVSHEQSNRFTRSALKKLHLYLEKTYPLVHGALPRRTFGEGALLYTWEGTDPTLAPLVLLAHTDVVPIASPDAWTHGPFSGAITDGFIWGRGTLDDKGAVIAILEAVEAALAAGFTPTRTVYLAFGHDEEVGGKDGAVRIAAYLKEKGVTPALVLDEGGVVLTNAMSGMATPLSLIGVAEKGYLSVKLSAKSEGGHSSMPPSPTAVGLLAAAVHRLESEQMPARLAGVNRDFLQTVAPHATGIKRVALSNLWLLGPLVKKQLAATPATNAQIRTTTAPTMLSGSPKENVLAARATAVVNFRLLPGDSRRDVMRHVRRVVDDDRVQLTALSGGSDASPVSPADGQAFRWVAGAAKTVFPEAVPAPYLMVGATDGRHYTGLGGDVLRFLPTQVEPEDLKRIHGVDERISVENFAAMIRFYGVLLREAGAPPP